MRLIGMPDSPYVRRVAISLKLLGLPFEHTQLSVFRDFEAFAAINPVVKAPTLVTDDGVTLLDSTLILEYAERLAEPSRSLVPNDPRQHARALRLIGLALAACEKAVQIEYETHLRPADKLHRPWLERVERQLLAAYAALEEDVEQASGWLSGERPLQSDVTVAVAWRFTQHLLPEVVRSASFPRLAAFSARAESLPEFVSTPLE
ncbi:MAG: glutathione S-transferase [Methylocystaceae bacterium]|nr:MAG: glutathione S-transferase [Methylocystaceae bacterium]